MDAQQIEARLREELSHAADFVRLGRAHVERQRQLVQTFKRDGHDVTLAAALLQTLEETQALHEEGLRRLQEELAALQMEQSLVNQSRSELHRRAEGLKESNKLLSSAADVIEHSKALLNDLPEKKP
jgi:hypothetical protein